MNFNDKTKKDLIVEFEELRQNYDSLKVNYNKDIAQYKQAEEVYRKMVDNSPRGMHFYKLNNNNELIFTGANPAANKILKINNSQFIGKVRVIDVDLTCCKAVVESGSGFLEGDMCILPDEED